jgi:pyruvate formate lyase activating enzyme
MSNKKGLVLRVERASINDGDGLRTVIYLKGCPLRCAWCSTPESQRADFERAGRVAYGQLMTVEEVLDLIMKDAMFYFHSGGGVTLSGGEPLMQADFSAEVLRMAQREGINTALESSFSVCFSDAEKLLPYLDTVFADIKHIDPEKHKELCGADNSEILENIRRASAAEYQFSLIIRIPLIPSVNDDEDTLSGIGKFCAGLARLHHIQLLPYHRLGIDTYKKLGLRYTYPELRAPSAEHVEKCREIVRRYAKNVY